MAHAGAAGCCCRRYSLLWIALLQRSVTRLSETGKECGARAGTGGRAAPGQETRRGQRCPEQPPHHSGSRRAALYPGLSQQNEGDGRDRRDEARGERLQDHGALLGGGGVGRGGPLAAAESETHPAAPHAEPALRGRRARGALPSYSAANGPRRGGAAAAGPARGGGRGRWGRGSPPAVAAAAGARHGPARAGRRGGGSGGAAGAGPCG